MTREYNRELSLCLGTCERMLKPRHSKKFPDHAARHARGMCWSCYAAHFDVRRRPVPTDEVRRATAALEGFLASRRKRGVPAEGIPVRLRRAS